MTRIACLVVPGAGEEAQQHLLELALAHSPSVEDGGPGVVYLDLRGLEGLFGARVSRRGAATTSPSSPPVRTLGGWGRRRWPSSISIRA